ncbi:MAG: hypothetical protein A2431_03435 [Candidatus Zambryskibacteria bacterium RIFOXYC1_FULL_39_10]|uniref:Uncharacterized protein n=1 Tax=Candidatus Zambryskibacteria bacterium RIFOXYC1_FULL_39_10 TaxID=1802779 RepID=A0A1G2UZC8_9BACT|nr:MAG: hypothetical protein A2431_03435 [Candidatus Zambryskibacteria bacterium RIFOXYC1_FULL_39_10]OHB16927.1 MAG: hypothetical protein A2605_00470 [Candidatus Zambryskibacteria bacterium RIFOXYD1_FULL_39_35]
MSKTKRFRMRPSTRARKGKQSDAPHQIIGSSGYDPLVVPTGPPQQLLFEDLKTGKTVRVINGVTLHGTCAGNTSITPPAAGGCSLSGIIKR